MTETEETSGTFVVTHADEGSAVLRDVDAGQVHTLGENPGVERGDVLEATLAAEPPMEVTWAVRTVDGRRHVAVEESPEPPTTQERDIAAEQSVGEVTRRERAGKGEIHVISVTESETESAVDDVLEDDETLARAARIPSVTRVEVRSEAGLVSVRYLP
jgi:hypothetical protein